MDEALVGAPRGFARAVPRSSGTASSTRSSRPACSWSPRTRRRWRPTARTSPPASPSSRPSGWRATRSRTRSPRWARACPPTGWPPAARAAGGRGARVGGAGARGGRGAARGRRRRSRRRARGPGGGRGRGRGRGAGRARWSSRPGRGRRRSSTRAAAGGRSSRCGASVAEVRLAGAAAPRARAGRASRRSRGRAAAAWDRIFSTSRRGGVSAVGSTFLDDRAGRRGAGAGAARARGALRPGAGRRAGGRHAACARPQSLDGRPLLGPLPGVEGLHVAAGHGPWGISLGPGSARLVADGLLGRGGDPAGAGGEPVRRRRSRRGRRGVADRLGRRRRPRCSSTAA